MTKAAVDRVLEDPDNHYPYHAKKALDAGWPKALVDVSERVVKAQEAYLRDPSDENLQARNDAEKEAQRVSSELTAERVDYAFEQQIKDRKSGGRGVHISLAGDGS